MYLAAGQLGQVRLQLFSDHRVDGHQAENAGLPHTALCVVVALQQQMIQTKANNRTAEYTIKNYCALMFFIFLETLLK